MNVNDVQRLTHQFIQKYIGKSGKFYFVLQMSKRPMYK